MAAFLFSIIEMVKTATDTRLFQNKMLALTAITVLFISGCASDRSRKDGNFSRARYEAPDKNLFCMIEFRHPRRKTMASFSRISGKTVYCAGERSYVITGIREARDLFNLSTGVERIRGAGNASDADEIRYFFTDPLSLGKQYRAIIDRISIDNDPKFEIIHNSIGKPCIY